MALHYPCTDVERGDRQCPGGTACSRHRWSGGTGYPGTDGLGDHLFPTWTVRGDRLWRGLSVA